MSSPPPDPTPRSIWLIGGTQDSTHLAQALIHAAIPTVVTVTTESARHLYPTHPLLTILVGTLDPGAMGSWLQHHRIAGILDASHPFARIVSQGAIAAAQRHRIPYLRYERPSLGDLPPAPAPSDWHPQDLEETLWQGRRILLILGYRMLPQFQPWHDRATLFARILPSEIALKTALNAGFSPARLIALRPPISVNLERALWQQWDISLVITKASGQAGGEDIKRYLAEELGIPLVVLPRPFVAYPDQTSTLDQAIAFCQNIL